MQFRGQGQQEPPSAHTTRSTGLASDNDVVQKYTDALARSIRNSKGWQLLLDPGTDWAMSCQLHHKLSESTQPGLLVLTRKF